MAKLSIIKKRLLRNYYTVLSVYKCPDTQILCTYSQRRQDPDNRRRVLITLTRQAQRFQKALEEELEKEMIRIADRMNSEDFNIWVTAYKAIDLAMDDIYGSKE